MGALSHGGASALMGRFLKKNVGWGWGLPPCVIKQPLALQSLIPGFGVTGDSDRDLILGDRLLSIMTKKHIIIKGCSTSYE